MSRFASLCAVVVANAANYRSELACYSMIARVRRAWESAGCYGCNKAEMQEAVAAIQNRLFELSWKRRFGVESW